MGGCRVRRKELATGGQDESKKRPQWFLACAASGTKILARVSISLADPVALGLVLIGADTLGQQVAYHHVMDMPSYATGLCL